MRSSALVGFAGVFALACAASDPEGENRDVFDENSRIDGNASPGRDASLSALGAGRKRAIGTVATLLAGLNTEDTRLSKRFTFWRAKGTSS
jgi:hypothetical protein